ncbi:hypothetical protein LOZ39_003445 [Ophidiomyces ophidiicola]|uniref:uncharacterized protein n=1 Tax=Ophidiomyces ophidiicola TaxID=1387563 RepID=UPI0020C4C985|nr:uncharacterized protein LOZ57_001923 [Ophidiomyces ophidiicola]KAI1910784.1 hypothetical protein LOZ61_004246 [Ophidiomyces ophidiicola]KAI1929039.1 hypothetical protein LOZ60_001954 [Ophidiomyces ophidiicola]KAI1950364.1 hypothetical protein LOZ57_001923 [Ophidiomyces ophidiicola]KAI2008184.1 hypothetical protein LOZ50_002182 [Ophidiomyces ophidiicola]KAI2016830.1 hypothetical protein LOZ46_004793 [Ophidiomyces ophidiicola]
MENASKSLSVWTGLDRGLVGVDGVATRRCSTSFLSALYNAFMEVVVCAGDPTILQKLLEPIRQELYRLQLYPTLYPTSDVQYRFRRLLVQGLQAYFYGHSLQSDGPETVLAADNLVARRRDTVLQILNFPPSPLHLLPWERFLLKESPGSGVKFPAPRPQSITRLMPIGGVALHLRWLRSSFQSQTKTIFNVALLQQHKDRPSTPLPSSGLIHRQTWISLTPNQYFEQFGTDMRDPEITDKLESLSTVIELLENEPLADYNSEPAGSLQTSSPELDNYIQSSRTEMSGNEVSAVHRALNNLFTTLSPEQVQTFLSEMNASSNRTIVAAPPISAPITSDSFQLVTNPTTFTSMGSSIMPRPSPRSKRTRENGKLRPLNSFIAFRSFYSAAFPDLSQKVKSGLIRFLWNSDPFKGKWAILAKAYSVIRDKHSEQVSLESFLALNGPFIGIVPAADYLAIMGLKLVEGSDKQYSIATTSHQANVNPLDLITNLSSDDIVDYCYQTGYVQGIVPGKDKYSKEAALAMAVAAQPSCAADKLPTSTLDSATASTQLIARSNVEDIAPPSDNNALVTTSSEIVRRRIPTAIHPAVANNAALIAQNFGNGAVASNGPYTAADFEQEIRSVMNAFPFDAEDDSYYGLFNPALRTPVVVYNPYRIQSDFDAFDVGEYTDI